MRGIRTGALSLCFLSMFLAGALAGCFCNGPYIATVEWTQGGIYGDFPPKGEYGDYRIKWSEKPPAWRSAVMEDGATSTHLRVEVSGNATFHVFREHNDGRVPTREFYGLLNGTFDDLGISVRPTPAVQGSPVRQGTGTC